MRRTGDQSAAGRGGPDRPARHARAAAIAAGAALLLWPAALNGYPLVFSDTGAFLAQTVLGWPVWDKPFVYGPVLHAFHWRLTLWLPVAAQGLALSWLLWLVQRALGGATPGRHLLLCAGLAAATAAPWFAASLMPDWLAPALVLALFLLGFGWDGLARWERAALGLLALLACAAHLSHLPLAAALAPLVLALRRDWRPALRCALPLAGALALLLATNAWAHGRWAVSPHGAVFALARLVADGPAARTIAARCPEAGWHLCRWAGRLPADSDEFLWSPAGPVWAPRTDGAQPGGPISLAPEAAAILAETLRREPLAVLQAAALNTWRQLFMARVGDTLGPENLEASVARQLALGFPRAEQARFAASLQARGLLRPAAQPFLALHPAALLLGAAGTLLAWARVRDKRRLGLVLCVLVGVAANAAATGALSGPHDRYQARIAWLLPLAALLASAAPARADAVRAGSPATPSPCPAPPSPPPAPLPSARTGRPSRAACRA
ncbi:hypothetical protein [Paracraurococcus lichenis]|uniref:Glycosyltransferase RgtA/B/C/D-like domain-containing protein n=1 Tax=Paracraurococcus lichenis TaxID=3064888 RepID=A0ABT9E0J4_9PROT|nr:hypothetical protein [Paracraurococcus sp. LOR1-02]MDO9709675.1 hypothetical protein [Paracraurococcus sp. LOR1-02]